MIHILGISGSLRRGSFNTAALRAAARLAPDDVEVRVLTLHGIPMFDPDSEERDVRRPAVLEFREAIRAADGLLIATPEYNFSITGALKNAIDWASRGGADSPLNGKPAAILGAGGRFGTLRSQLHLREILLHNRVDVVPGPQVMIDLASKRFDEEGRLIGDRHAGQIERLMEALRDRVLRSRTP